MIFLTTHSSDDSNVLMVLIVCNGLVSRIVKKECWLAGLSGLGYSQLAWLTACGLQACQLAGLPAGQLSGWQSGYKPGQQAVSQASLPAGLFSQLASGPDQPKGQPAGPLALNGSLMGGCQGQQAGSWLAAGSWLHGQPASWPCQADRWPV